MATTKSIYSRLTTIALRNVLRNWRHSMATILAIASGFMAVSLFDGFLQELNYRNIEGYAHRGMLGQLIIQKKDAQYRLAEDQWAYSLGKAEQDFVDNFLQSQPNFKSRIKFLSVTGMISTPAHNAVMVGIGHDLKRG